MSDTEFVDLVNELAALPESYHFAAANSASQLDLPEDQRGPPDVIFKAIDQLNHNDKGKSPSPLLDQKHRKVKNARCILTTFIELNA